MKRSSIAFGFTLLELAISMLILGLIAVSLMGPVTRQIEQGRINDTQKTLDEVRDALMAFSAAQAVVHLPCPDTSAIPDGIEDRLPSGACVNAEGVLPWVTLGVGSSDAWNRRLRYRVTPAFASSVTAFTVSSAGVITVCANTPCPNAGLPADTLTNNAAALVYSTGANGFGGRMTDGTAMPAPTSAHELENANLNNNFVSRVPTSATSALGEFDDMLTVVPASVLVGRMIQASRLP
jgi:type II secretory pathway pseudopilin PulG